MASFLAPQSNPVHMAPVPLNKVSKPSPARPRRYKAAVACTTCRSRKVKCDGVRPVCGRCQKEAELRGQCSYTPTAEVRASPLRGDGHSPSHQRSKKKDAPPSQGDDQAEPGPFVCKVRAAINAKVSQQGMQGPSDNETHSTPLLDTPLFGSLPLGLSPDSRQPADRNGVNGINNDNVLPPRKHADDLLSYYWRHLESIEPCLDQESFHRSYQALYVGGDLNTGSDERIFTSTLNVVFALAVQLQEPEPSEQRNNASSAFFSRAWTLLRPESIFCEQESIELVQCLLLMSRYLQCTNSSHQTSMVLGAALRIAQNLDFHLPKPLSKSGRHAAKHRELWYQCAYMDRSLSWSLGKPLALYLVSTQSLPTPATAASRRSSASTLPTLISDSLIKLDEMTGHILLAERLAHTTFGETVGLPSSASKWSTATAMHVEEGLAELSSSFEQEIALHAPDESAARRIRLFRLRLAHTRVLLFRPMLARFCLNPHRKTTEDNSLHDHLLRSCSSLCVENTAKMLTLVCETYTTSPTLLPWWYRVFYLFVSSQHLLAAMLRPDVFSPQVHDLWGTATQAFAAHEHLSPAVKHCSSHFVKLAQKITDTHNAVGFANADPIPMDAQWDGTFQDIFQQFGFDLDGQYFNFQDSTLWSMDWNMGSF